LSRRFSISGFLQALAWTALIGGYLVIGVPEVGRALRGGVFYAIGPFHSTDQYLKSLTGLEHASQRIERALGSLAANKPIVVFVREREAQHSFLALLLIYLGWPREMEFLHVHDADAMAQLQKRDPAKLAAIIFCGVKMPIDAPTAVRLSSDVWLLPMAPAGPESAR
jgi:hypothetical protein